MNITKGKTGNALTSAAADHVIAVAADIYDETLNKYQSDFNLEVKNNKVDKVTGKLLSTEDFTTALKTKLEGLSNYNDTEVKNKINALQTLFNTLLESNPDQAINSFNEIIAFLAGIQDTQTLEGILNEINTKLNTKVDKVTGKQLSTNDFTNENKEKLDALPTNTELIDTLATKADISDLSNVIAEDVIDETNFSKIEQLTREELKQDLFADQWQAWGGKVNREPVSTTTVYDNIISGSQSFIFEVVSIEYFKVEDTVDVYLDLAETKSLKCTVLEIEPNGYSNSIRFLPFSTSNEVFEVPAGVKIVTEGGDIRSYSKFDVTMDYAKALRIYGMHEFIDKWNNACGTYGKYNAETEYYELNGLTDITYEQALKIMYYGRVSMGSNTGWYRSAPIRTNFRIIQTWAPNNSDHLLYQTFLNSQIEVASVEHGKLRSLAYCKCKKLHTINDVMELTDNDVNNFTECIKLTNVKIILSFNLNVSDSPLLSLSSFQYMVTNAENTSAITITVHPDVYAKITGDTTNAAAAALTAEELAQWQQLLVDASAKNITFATV